LQVKRIAVGKVKSSHGVKGEVKIACLTDFPSRFQPGLVLYPEPSLPQIKSLILESVKTSGNVMILKFENVDSREKADELKGHTLEVLLDEDDIKSLPEGTYWQFQIIGLDVVTSGGLRLGKVSEILKTGANDVYIVKSDSAKEVLIPAIKDVVRKVDLKKGIIVIEPIPGLIDEN